MDIDVKHFNRQINITLDGKLDAAGDKELAKTLHNIDRFGEYDIVSFDMRKVTYATSSGIGRILNFFKVLETNECLMEINGISETLYEQFKEIHLETLFPIHRERK